MRARLEIVIALVAAGYLCFILALVRRRQLREKYALLWLGVGLVAIVLSLARTAADRLAHSLGIAYGPSALFLFSTMFLMAVVAHLSWEVSRLEDKTRRLAEEIALLKAGDSPAAPPRSAVSGAKPGFELDLAEAYDPAEDVPRP